MEFATHGKTQVNAQNSKRVNVDMITLKTSVDLHQVQIHREEDHPEDLRKEKEKAKAKAKRGNVRNLLKATRTRRTLPAGSFSGQNVIKAKTAILVIVKRNSRSSRKERRIFNRAGP